jgi:hypothetical protein
MAHPLSVVFSNPFLATRKTLAAQILFHYIDIGGRR